jgi:hypothetical protein
MAMNTFFTVGHSTRTLPEFVDLLRESSIDLVVDVRSVPRSRTNPHFNLENLPEGLAPWQIGYKHMAELGGLRGKQRLTTSSPNAYWKVRSFQNYADYALTAHAIEPPIIGGARRSDDLGSARTRAMPAAKRRSLLSTANSCRERISLGQRPPLRRKN